MHLAYPRKQARTWRALILATALLSLVGCSTTEPARPDQNLPTTKAETVETMNAHLRLLLEGVMFYQTAPVPPSSATPGTIRRYGCLQGNTDYSEGPPWQYFFTTGDIYTPDKERLLVERIHDLTETGWVLVRSPETDVHNRWTIKQEQSFVLSVKIPTEQEMRESAPYELSFWVTSSSPCVDVVDNDL